MHHLFLRLSIMEILPPEGAVAHNMQPRYKLRGGGFPFCSHRSRIRLSGAGWVFQTYAPCYVGSRSITRMIATVFPVFLPFSGIPLAQDHTSPFLALNSIPPP
jgi:hypothetical protein